MTEERLEALSNGADPTDDEKHEYRKRVIAQVEDGSADADVIPEYWVRRLRHTDGREVFAVETDGRLTKSSTYSVNAGQWAAQSLRPRYAAMY